MKSKLQSALIYKVWNCCHLLNILCSFSRGFHENQTMFFGKLLSFLSADSTSMSKVTFVPNQHDGHVSICVLSCIFQPACQMIKCLPPEKKQFWCENFQQQFTFALEIKTVLRQKIKYAPGDIIDQQSTSSSSIVGPRDRPKRFLASLYIRKP